MGGQYFRISQRTNKPACNSHFDSVQTGLPTDSQKVRGYYDCMKLISILLEAEFDSNQSTSTAQSGIYVPPTDCMWLITQCLAY